MPLRILLPASTSSDPFKRAEAFVRHAERRRLKAAQQFDFPALQVGRTPDGMATLYFDPSLGQPGRDLANALLAQLPATGANCQSWFAIPGQPVNVILAALDNATDGSGGAYHYGCDFAAGGDLYCDAALGNVVRTNGLVVAELAECFMGAQNGGWDCGGSNGEALSRFLAELESGGAGGALSGFATAPAWDAAGRPDWIDATESTDQDDVSTGCGVAYLYWMRSKGFAAAQIAQAGCPDGTLASNYAGLTHASTAWADFSAAAAALPAIASDDPWSA